MQGKRRSGMARPWRPRYARPRPPRRARASIAHAHTWQNCRLGCRFVQTPSQQGGGSRMGGRRLRHARHSSPTSPALDASPDSACPRPTTNAAVLRPIHRLRPFPHARPRCWHMPQRGVPRPVSCYYKLAPGQQRVPALRLMMATTPARLMTWRPGSSRASPASSSTRLGGSGRCSSRGGSGRRRLRRGRWRSRRRWFPWRVRSRVGVAEPEVMWREVCVCVCVWT